MKTKIKIFLLFFVSLFILLVFFISKEIAPEFNENKIYKESTFVDKVVDKENKLKMLIGDESFSVSLPVNSSVYDALLYLKNEKKIDFTGKNYPSLGFFVDSVGTLKAFDGKNIFYYVNGEEANVGISSYLIKDGDVIEWKLK